MCVQGKPMRGCLSGEEEGGVSYHGGKGGGGNGGGGGGGGVKGWLTIFPERFTTARTEAWFCTFCCFCFGLCVCVDNVETHAPPLTSSPL